VSRFLLKLGVLPLYINNMKCKFLFHRSRFLSINITIISRNTLVTFKDPFIRHHIIELDKLKDYIISCYLSLKYYIKYFNKYYFALMCRTLVLFSLGNFVVLFYTKPVTWGEVIFPKDLRLNFNYYFNDNKFPVEIKEYSYSNIRYNTNKSVPFISFARIF
jgi:hypothetical protein